MVEAIGQRLQSGEDVYTPWFPRQADYAVFRAQLIDKGSGGEVTIRVFHKKAEDTGDGAEVGGTDQAKIVLNGAAGSIGIKDVTNGIKELVRLKYSGSGSSWARFRMLAPSWYNAAKP